MTNCLGSGEEHPIQTSEAKSSERARQSIELKDIIEGYRFCKIGNSHVEALLAATAY